MSIDTKKPTNLKSILGHCERVVNIVASQQLSGASTLAIHDICKHTLEHWRDYCNYFQSDLPYRIARALEPYSTSAPESKAESVPLLATGAIWVLFAVVLEDSKRAQLAASFAISSTLATTHVVPNAGEVVEFLVPWIGKKAACHDNLEVRLDFCAMVGALSHAPGWTTTDDSWVKAFKKAGGPRVLAQLVDATRLLADGSPRNIVEVVVALGCVRSLVRGVHELAKTFVRDGGLPARIIQCVVPDASPALVSAVLLHAADPFAQLKSSCMEFLEHADMPLQLLDTLADPAAFPLDLRSTTTTTSSTTASTTATSLSSSSSASAAVVASSSSLSNVDASQQLQLQLHHNNNIKSASLGVVSIDAASAALMNSQGDVMVTLQRNRANFLMLTHTGFSSKKNPSSSVVGQ